MSTQYSFVSTRFLNSQSHISSHNVKATIKCLNDIAKSTSIDRRTAPINLICQSFQRVVGLREVMVFYEATSQTKKKTFSVLKFSWCTPNSIEAPRCHHLAKDHYRFRDSSILLRTQSVTTTRVRATDLREIRITSLLFRQLRITCHGR